MKMNVVIIGLASTLLFAGQTAFAQEASVQNADAQSSATQTQVKTTKRIRNVVREPLLNQKKPVQKAGKTRVIHDVNKAHADMNVYRRSVNKTSTPNLYRD